MLIEEYRGGILENIHEGRICVVGEDGNILGGCGDVNALTYYRSAAKPFQLLPLFMRKLHKKYGFSDAEVTVCAASHTGEDIHINALESLLKKTGLKEDDLIMLPTVPLNKDAYNRFIRMGEKPRRLYHNCAGKHIALMVLQRELTGSHEGYWRLESAAQREVLSAISAVSNFQKEKIICGIDGCGVPVFAVPLVNIAISYQKLAFPQGARKNSALGNGASVNNTTATATPAKNGATASNESLKDNEVFEAGEELAAALEYMSGCIERNPYMIRGHGHFCSEINAFSNIVSKDGAEGVYGLGLKNERIGIALKVADGSHQTWPIIIKEILSQLGYKDESVFDAIDNLKSATKTNDNNIAIGNYRPTFKLFQN